MKNNYCINIGRIICIAFIIMLFSRCQNKKNIDNQPNVIFIIADDLADRLSCYGDSVANTPNLDNLAKRGVLFANSFCQYPTCGPSRASLFSGLYPFESGYTSNKGKSFNHVLPNIVTLPSLLRKNGYFTARVGKIFHMGIPGDIGTSGTDDTLA